MRVPPSFQPLNRGSTGTRWIRGTIDKHPNQRVTAAALFLLAAAATLTIWIRDPFVSWGYEVSVFILAAWWSLKAPRRGGVETPALAAIALWGFAQLALSATVYRYATLEASLRLAALTATAFAASLALEHSRLRGTFLRAFAAFGCVVAIWAVLEYYTSAGRILWIFPSGYPDAWGPFPSRNNFAEFLELTLPVALWLSAIEDRLLYKAMAASMLAAGLASASRAGASLLILETIVVLSLLRRKGALRQRAFWQIMAASAALVAVAGAGQLAGRMRLPHPLEYRYEIARSTLAMISERPLRGFGLGTFATVYPAYASFDTGAIVDHAHNDWLEWASEGGITFAAVWAVLALATLRPAIRTVWGLGVPAIFLHAMVDYPFARFGLTAWIFILIGALGSADKREKSGVERLVRFKTVQSVMAAMMALDLSLAHVWGAAPPVIGTVVAKGSFLLDNSAVTGNATLFEGVSIETGTAGSSMELSGGAKIFMAPESKGKFFDDHMILEKGGARLDKAPGFHLEALGLTIQPDMSNSSARMTLTGKRVDVLALTGSFHVLNSRGLLVANLAPGRVLQLEPQSANGLSRLSGCVVKKRGHFVLTDETTKVVVELTGPGLEKEAGNRIEIAGNLDPAAQPTSDASQVIRVTSVTRRGNGCVGDAAAPAGAGGSPGSGRGAQTPGAGGGGVGGAAAGHAVSMATIAIIGGVAAAAAVGGVVAARASSQNGSSASISR